MAIRNFSMRETDVKYMPKVGDRVQALTRGSNYNNGELGEIVYVDNTKVSVSTSRGMISVPLDAFSTDFRVMRRG